MEFLVSTLLLAGMFILAIAGVRTVTVELIITIPAGIRNTQGVKMGSVDVTASFEAGESAGIYKTVTPLGEYCSYEGIAVPFTDLLKPFNLEQFGGRVGWNVRHTSANLFDGLTTSPLKGFRLIQDASANGFKKWNKIATVNAQGGRNSFYLTVPPKGDHGQIYAQYVLFLWIPPTSSK